MLFRSVSATGNITGGNLVTSGQVSTSGNITAGNLTVNTKLTVGSTYVNSATLTTTSITANQAIATVSTTGITGIEFLVKGSESGGGKYTVATVHAVTDGSTADYSIYGGVNLGGSTGSLNVVYTSGNFVLQVTPASSNSTVWTTQYRTI